MSILIISYDLIKDKDYTELINEIKSISSWAKPLESFWLLKTDLAVGSVRDRLKAKVDKDDKLLVIEAGNWWATYNISSKVTDWMKENI